MKKMIETNQVETSFKKIEEALKNNGLYALYNRNLEDKLERIGGYHYGNPKQ